jgi:hypothetical protein
METSAEHFEEDALEEGAAEFKGIAADAAQAVVAVYCMPGGTHAKGREFAVAFGCEI